MNEHRYVQFLEKAIEFFSLKLNIHGSELYVMLDNARPNVAQIVKNWLREEGATWVKQPPYSLDFNLMDIFRNFETHQRGKSVRNNAGVSELITSFLDQLSPRMLRKEFQKFCEHLTIVSENDGDYI